MDAILKTQAEPLANELATQVRTLDDLNGLIRTLTKTALERMLNTEMDVHLGRRSQPVSTTDTPTPNAPATNTPDATQAALKNRRNGHSQKTVPGDWDDLQLRTAAIAAPVRPDYHDPAPEPGTRHEYP